MPQNGLGRIAQIVSEQQNKILSEWLGLQKQGGTLESGRISEAELQTQCRTLLGLLVDGLAQGGTDANAPAFEPVMEMLTDVSRSRAMQGFTPTETATFVFSLKQPLFNVLNRTADAAFGRAIGEREVWEVTLLLDQFGLHTMDAYQRSRDEVILRQGREISELSTPVVKMWAGILALPLIGTLDSERTQVVMENLLQAIVDQTAEIAIIDITGVPTVDTLTAQHLLKTVAAARLMGADCIISGIRPQIAQTMVHLGVELNVTTKATLADAFAVALARIGRTVVRAPRAEAAIDTRR
ncbi:MAG TPA: STAS domain-containing protein [Azospirillaceae bacterium]|nr:STAS domain-containing protein [Azospirillaceae bacterium]